MKRNIQVFRLMVFLLTLPLAGSVVARDLSLSEAVRRGLETSPDLRMGRADLRKAEAEKAASVAGMAPRLSIESKVFYWDSATDMTFDLLHGLDPRPLRGSLQDFFAEVGDR